MSDKSKTKPERWYYCHRWCNKNGELWFMYLKESDLGSTKPESLLFGRPLCSKKKSSLPVIGGLYELKVERSKAPDEDEENVTVRGAAKWIMGEYAPEDKRVEWSARDEGEYGEHMGRKAHKKAKADDPMWEALEPIKRAYWNTNSRGQRALLAKVLTHITARPPRPFDRD